MNSVVAREILALLHIVSEIENVNMQGVSISRLIQQAFRHKTIYQLQAYSRLHPGLFTAEQTEHLETRSRKIAMQSLTQLQELKRIAEVFNIQQIGYVCIKGPQLSRMIYGREALKESVDLDIMLTDAGNLLKVHSLLSSMGYDQSNLNEYSGKLQRKIFLIAKREIHYFNRANRCAIDLHIRPGANTYLTENRFKGFLEDLTTYNLEGTRVPVLKDEAYLVYLCYHGALHQFARLAWLLDIRAFLRLKNQQLNFEKVLSIARERSIERCVLLAFQLIHEYFGEDYPVVLQDICDNRILRLSAICYSTLEKEASYGLSLWGRWEKVVYIMLLLKGFSSKVDWLYGILTRQIIIRGRTKLRD